MNIKHWLMSLLGLLLAYGLVIYFKQPLGEGRKVQGTVKMVMVFSTELGSNTKLLTELEDKRQVMVPVGKPKRSFQKGSKVWLWEMRTRLGPSYRLIGVENPSL